MDTFSYLSVMFSVIMGLALTQILQGLRAHMLVRERVKLYWPALIWALFMILAVTQAWWAMFGMRDLGTWNFAKYAAVVLQVTLIYLASGVVLPDPQTDGIVDMRVAYFKHARWFFGLMATTVAATFLKDFVTIGHISLQANTYYLAGAFVVMVLGAISRSRWFHALLAPLCVIMHAAYTALLSFRL